MTSFYGEYRAKDIISDEEENRVSRANVDKWIFRLLLILIGFMPLIVLAHTKETISPLISDVPLLSSGTKGDLFTYYKSLIVLVITIITGILLFAKIFFMNGKIRKTKINYFLALFTFAIVLSTILSPNITIALNGQYNRSDGGMSWLCYIALMFIAMNINYPKKAVNYVMYTLIPFVIINSYIIAMNFTGNDLLQKSWMQGLIGMFLPDGSTLSANSQLVGTLNQWNYMSGMFAVLTIMFLTASILEKRLALSIIFLIVSIISIAVMLMSLSTSGFLTVSILMLLVLFIVFKSEYKVRGFAFIAAFILLTAPIFHILAEKNPRVWSESIGFVIKTNPYVEKQVSLDTGTKFESEFDFMSKVYASENSFELPELPESGISAGTGRVYIWDKTMDLVKERPIFGLGMDTLMYRFPHFNIDARAGLRTEETIVDKPHNVYIGTLYGTGLIGFIGLVGLVIITTLLVLKAIFGKQHFKENILGVAWLAFLVQALFNDSLPGTTAIMFVVAGIMMAYILNNKEEKEHF